MLVGISHVADGRNHHGDFRLFLTHSWDDKKRNVILIAFFGSQLNAVGIALEAIRNGPFEIDFPTGVVDVIIMKMDGAIFLLGVLPIKIIAREIVTGHGTRWAVDDLSIEQIRPMVLTNGRINAVRKIPGSDNRLGQRIGGTGIASFGHTALGAEFHRLDFRPAQRPVTDSWAIDLAVVEAGDNNPGRHR